MKYRLPERAASSAAPESALFSRLRLEFPLELAGEFDESRRQTNIFVERVALIVTRNDLGTSLIRHGGGNFVETGMQQVGNDHLERLPRKQFSQGMQSRGIVQLQAYCVLLRRSHRRRLFLPTIEQGLEFHDYSAIPDYKDMGIIDRRQRSAGARYHSSTQGNRHERSSDQ